MAMVAAAGALAGAAAGSAAGQAESTFDTDLEGWGAYADGAISFAPSVGQPAGSAEVVDFLGGGYFGFTAPAAFLGNRCGCYGGELSFDLLTNNSSTAGASVPDVEIRGGGLTLELDLAPPPAGQWVSRSIPLSTAADWRVSSLAGPAATEAQIRQVLADVTLLHIRGEFSTQSDVTNLDNVRLSCDGCRADLNGSGAADPGDFTAWIAAYNAGDLAADQNCSGALDPGDFTAWVANYNAGC
ncbi:MAG: laminin B domain-containing protein [Phycisphaerales bacterium]